TNIPYNSNIAIGGDYLPLTSVNGTVVSCPITITSDSVLANDITCSNEGNAIVMGANGITLDCSNNIITGLGTDAGIYVNSKSNVVIKNCNITNFYYGIEIINSDNVQINSSNYLYENDFYAIYQYNSTNTKVVGNRIINDNNGIYSINSQNTLISGNTINLQKKFYGIYSFGSSGSLIENNTMFDNYHGIYLVNSDSTTANNNNISSSDVYSLYLHSTTDNSNFANNTLSAGQEGIRIKSNSNFNTFTSNNITDHSNYGLHSTDSSSNKFISNNFVNNSVTAATSNIYLSNSPDYNFTNDVIVNGSKGAVIIDSSNNLFLSLNTINATNKPSLQVNDSSSPILKNNTIYSNAELNNADNAVISPGNTISTNLTLTNSDNVTIDNNNLQNVYITNSDDSTISNNILKILKLVNFGSGTVNTNDIDNVVGTSFDFQIVTSSNIYDNNIQSVTNAIVLSNSSNSNNLYDNWLKDNTIGLNITSSTGNNIYNNYFNNVQNVFDDSGNNWNSSYTCAAPNIIGGPCKGGNFYSNYAGLDNGANNREQGDGIGDQPPTHTIAAGTFDYLPLVLYVARQYYAPDYPYNETFIAYGNVSGYLTDGEVVPNQVQKINYTNSNNAYLELTALFNQSDVHAETLKIDFNANKTAVNKTGVTGIASNYNVYLSHNYEFDYGVYVCEEKYNLSLDETCSPRIDLTAIGTDASGLVLGQSGNHYIVSNIRNNSVTAGINKNGLCNASILHDVTLTQNISCNGNAFIVKADNIIIDFAGYILTGNSSGIGVNISNYNGVVIKNANIVNFSTAIHADPAEGINITNSNISSSSIGIKFDQINKSFITNNFIRNNNIGINLSSSYNNTIYNNYFNNTNNVVDDGINTYNVSNVTGTNILCTAITAFNLSITCNENAFGGNFWSNYNGWDTDLDGVGETLLPYNNSNSVTTGGDYLPLTEVGKIACGGTVQNVTTNITLNRNLSTTGTCFTIGAGNIILDGAGFTILGNTSGYGINNSAGFDNITIKNFAINNFTNGIRATGMVNSNIFNNTIESANVSNGYGIYLYSSSNNTLLSNTITTSGNSGLGIFFQSSINNSLRSNTVTTFGSDGRGINLYSSSNNTLLSNTITTSGNSGLGVFLYSSSNNNTLLSNIITTSGSNGHGIFLGISSNNILLSNTVTTSGNGGYGIYFPSSVNNSDVQNNTITTNSSGIRISSSNNNTIHTNTITNNPLGINITSSYNNTIYNNYFNNTNNAWDNGTNYWNTTYVCSSSTINILGGNCTGGNYWSNYAGEDNGNATYPGLPNVTDDGIGDTEIPYNNSDNFTGGDYLPLVATSVCGNLVKESSEACDGSDFGGLSCIDYGYLYGSLSCTSCTIVSSACTNTSGSSSSSSSTSSGGGGGGGGAAALAQCNDKKDNDNDGKTDYPNDPGCESNNDNDETDPLSCKQNWQCGSWSACTNDLQKRTCYDINDCLSKKNAGEVDEIVVVLKPVESKKCEAEEVILPPEVPKQPSPPTEKELIVLPEIITKPGPVRTIALTSLILTGLLGGIYAFWQLGHTPNRLRRKIRRLSPLLEEEPSELLKEDYLDAYKLYLKLSEKNKQNFYPKITQLREKIETQLKAEKRIEELFKKVVQGGIEEQKKTYLKIFKDYQKLPEKVKQKYYTKIIQLRDRLERGG
ncbi:MAG: NosD domain-containing protein, partial [Nanoarchaeota archaeon]